MRGEGSYTYAGTLTGGPEYCGFGEPYELFFMYVGS
jgi:hypothetical protein